MTQRRIQGKQWAKWRRHCQGSLLDLPGNRHVLWWEERRILMGLVSPYSERLHRIEDASPSMGNEQQRSPQTDNLLGLWKTGDAQGWDTCLPAHHTWPRAVPDYIRYHELYCLSLTPANLLLNRRTVLKFGFVLFFQGGTCNKEIKGGWGIGWKPRNICSRNPKSIYQSTFVGFLSAGLSCLACRGSGKQSVQGTQVRIQMLQAPRFEWEDSPVYALAEETEAKRMRKAAHSHPAVAQDCSSNLTGRCFFHHGKY